jgi:hypothetical protein
MFLTDSAAFLMPLWTASSMLLLDEELISMTLATDMAILLRDKSRTMRPEPAP